MQNLNSGQSNSNTNFIYILKAVHFFVAVINSACHFDVWDNLEVLLEKDNKIEYLTCANMTLKMSVFYA